MQRRAWLLVALGLAGCHRAPALPPVYSTLPAFALIDQRGQPFGLEQLKGKVWVADFIFARCPSVCPVLTGKMAALEQRAVTIGLPVEFVSFSIDPEHDDPATLMAYAHDHGADLRHWTFLTGALEQIHDAVVGGFKIAAKPIGPDDDLASIFHGTHFVLVDQAGRVRGYYDTSDPARMEAVLRDAELLVTGR